MDWIRELRELRKDPGWLRGFQYVAWIGLGVVLLLAVGEVLTSTMTYAQAALLVAALFVFVFSALRFRVRERKARSRLSGPSSN